jgi:hypothetical protein
MFLSKEKLNKLYITEKRGTVEISKLIRCTPQAVMYWLAKYDIPLRSIAEANQITLSKGGGGYKTKQFFLTKEHLEREFVQKKKTPNQIASEFGCSWDVVRRNLLRNGFKLPQHTKGQGKRSSTIYRRFQKEALRKHGYKCQICGYDKFVNVCHIEPRFKGGSDAVENAIVLCPNHHAELDYGMLTLNQ